MKDIFQGGPPPEEAEATLILIHGRGASAEGMLTLYEEIKCPKIAALAPQAPGGTWYPHSFMAPIAENQPHLDHALQQVDSLVHDLNERGIPHDRVAFLVFSQGACLASEYVLRHPMRYGGLMVLTGGFIGPPGIERSDTGSFHEMPVFIGVNDPDAHVPFQRARDTADLFKRMKAEVELRRYPGMPHAVNDDEIEACRTLLKKVAAKSK
jgi:predicted esterase